MRDSVKVVELSGHNGRNVPEGSDLESSQSSTFLPDYYMEEDSEMVSKYLINLRAGISVTQNGWKKHPYIFFSTFGSKINEFELKKSEKNEKIPKT